MSRRAWPQILAPLAMLLLAVGLRVAEPTAVQELQLKVFDSLQRLYPRPRQEVPVRIVDIDDESLRLHGQWPWPRTRVAALVERLADLGAAVIAFDVVFAEPDRTSPRSVIPLWGETPELDALEGRLRDHDDVLTRVIAANPVVTGFVLTAEPPAGAVAEPDVKAGFGFGGEHPGRFLPDFPGAVVSLPALQAAAAGNGSFAIEAETDGVYRRVPLVALHRGELVPSLSVEALRVAVGGRTYLIKSAGASGEWSFGESTGITRLRIQGGFDIPTDSRGRMWLHYTEPDPARYVPAWQVLGGQADPALLEGHIVFVGTGAAGLKDLRTTPLDPVAPGVLLHAEATEQILLQHFLVRPDWATGAELLYMLALGGILVLLLPRVGPLWCAFVGVAAIAAVLGLTGWAFTRRMWLLDPVYPSVAVLFVYLAGSLLGFLRTEAERRQVRGAFGRYLSPALVEELARHPEKLALGGEMREMTLLFSDVRGFTSISEKLHPQQLTRLINQFLTPMTELILSRGGTIDKYMGDCIMAFWNAPLEDPDHARHACESGLAMLAELDALNERLRKEGEAEGRVLPPLRIGIGINTGRCCVGNMGSDQRFDYSVISDEVNLASRLEGQSKTYGLSLVIGENTREKVPDFPALELDLIRVKGKTQPARIYTLLGGPEVRGLPEFQQLADTHAEMLKAYRAGDWDRAAALLEECRGCEFELSGLYDLYAARIEACRQDPPPPDWGGVYDALTK